MKFLFAFGFILLSLVPTFSQNSEIVVQAGHSSFCTFTGLDSEREILVTYGAYDDTTLKFWNSKTGLLYKTIELPEHAKGVDLDKKNGILYVGFTNNIQTYNLNTLKEEKKFSANRLLQLVYSQADGKVYYFTGDYNEPVDLMQLDPATGNSSKASNVAYPSEGVPLYASSQVQGNVISFYTEFQEKYFYTIADQQFYNMTDNAPLAMMDNYDFIYVFPEGGKNVKVIRFNTLENKTVWERIVVTEDQIQNNAIDENQISISPDNKKIWLAPGKSTLVQIDAETGKVNGVIYNSNKKANMISDNEFVYSLEVPAGEFFYKGNYYKYRPFSAVPVAKFGSQLAKISQVNIDENPQAITLYSSDLENVKRTLLNNPTATQLTTYTPKTKNDFKSRKLVILPNKFLSIPDLNQAASFEFELNNAQSEKTLNLPSNNSEARFVDSKHKKLILLNNQNIEIVDLQNQKIQTKFNLPDVTRIFMSKEKGAEFSPNEKNLAICISDEEVFEDKYEYRLDYYDLNTQQRKWKIDKNYIAVQHSADGNKLYALNQSDKTLDVLNTQNGQILSTFSVGEIDHGFVSNISPDETKFTIHGYNSPVTTYDLNSGKIISASKSNRIVSGIFNDKIYYSLENMYLKFYNISTQQEILTVFLFSDNEWVAATPTGQFDGSQEGWKRVAFVQGKKSIPLDQVFDQFFTPRLIYKVLKGEDLDKKDINNLKEAPEVEILYSENNRNLIVEDDQVAIETQAASAKITLKGKAKNSSIASFHLFHNDKLVSNTRNLIVEDDSQNEKTYVLDLVPGENTLKAVVRNAEGTESAPEFLTVIYKEKNGDLPKTEGIQVHLLVVGINDYKNPKYNLNYAVADANGFKDKINSGIKSISSQVHTYFISNAEANKAAIVQKFNEIVEKANSQDIFVFYYAGHGVITTDANKEFFLVPYDVTQLYGADDALRQKGISANELKDLASKIPAQKQLYILDACQSAGALDVVAVRGAAEEKAIAQLARSTGTHWLTASGSEQFATEFDELGHGVFTYVLLDALSGKADSGDGRITVNELKAYLESQVPEVSNQYKGSPQYPSSFGFGQDFPIGIK